MVKMFSYIGEVFSADAPASFARWSTAATVATGCWALVHLVRINHGLPDVGQIAALATWMTAPYGISKISSAIAGRNSPSPPS